MAPKLLLVARCPDLPAFNARVNALCSVLFAPEVMGTARDLLPVPHPFPASHSLVPDLWVKIRKAGQRLQCPSCLSRSFIPGLAGTVQEEEVRSCFLEDSWGCFGVFFIVNNRKLAIILI